MNIVRIVVACFFSGIVASACATQSASSGSNSNWLSVCSKNSDCSSPLECICGLCTKSCSNESECSGLATGASCDQDVTGSLLCKVQPQKAACLIACKTDDDCSSLGAEGRCGSGACYKSTSNAAVDGGFLSCTDRQTKIVAAVEAVGSSANRTCSGDDDCVSEPLPRCVVGCGLPYVPRAVADAIEPQIPSLEQNLCGEYSAAGCFTVIHPCPNFGPPHCVAGRCYDNFNVPPDGGVDSGTAAHDGGSAPLTCQDRTNQISDRIQAAEASADRTCTTADDCTVDSLDLRCYHACGSDPLSTSGAAALATELTALETEFCPAFEAAGCVSFVPPCAPPPTKVLCVSNTCQY